MDMPFTNALCMDAEVATLFAPAAELEAMLAFEAALAKAQAEAGVIPTKAAAAIAQGCAAFVPQMPELIAGLQKDGVLGPVFVKNLRQTLPDSAQDYLHFGATSQDITDTALTLRLKTLLAMLDARLAGIEAALNLLEQHQGHLKIMAQTRMQTALPITVNDKLSAWQRPLQRHRQRLRLLAPRLLVIQLGGPVGTRAELGDKADAVAAGLAAQLGLGNAACWHNARDHIVELGAVLALIAGTCGKIGQDAALLAQSEAGALKIAGGGASSAMAHKANPVTAELLVALGRYTAGLAGTLNQAMLHENERSGAGWALEWFTLPPLAMAAGAALRELASLLPRLQFQPLPAPM